MITDKCKNQSFPRRLGHQEPRKKNQEIRGECREPRDLRSFNFER